LVLKITLGHFQPPHEVDPRIPVELSSVVARCLAKDTSQRYSSVNEVISDIKRIQVPADARASASTDDLETVVRPPRSPAAPVTIQSRDAEPHASSMDTPLAKSFPFGLVAVIGGAAMVLLIAAIGGVILFAGGSDAPAQASKPANATRGASNAGAQIKVDVDEGKAQVYRDGSALGSTPLSIDAALGDKLALTLKKDGFVDKEVTINVEGNKRVFTFSMKAK